MYPKTRPNPDSKSPYSDYFWNWHFFTVIFLYWAQYMGTWVFRSDADWRNISLGIFSSLWPVIWDSLFCYVRLGPGWMYFGRGCWKTLNYFHSPLQKTYPNDVNFLSKFTLTYNGSNAILISLYGWCFISFFFLQSWNNLEMSPLEAGAFSVQVTYTYKRKGFKRPHSWASIKLIIFNYYQRLLAND